MVIVTSDTQIEVKLSDDDVAAGTEIEELIVTALLHMHEEYSTDQ